MVSVINSIVYMYFTYHEFLLEYHQSLSVRLLSQYVVTRLQITCSIPKYKISKSKPLSKFLQFRIISLGFLTNIPHTARATFNIMRKSFSQQDSTCDLRIRCPSLYNWTMTLYFIVSEITLQRCQIVFWGKK